MAKRKFKSDVQLEGAVNLPNKTAERALIIDPSGNLAESTTTAAELAFVAGLTSGVQSQLDAKIDDSEKGAANGVATLDANSKIPSSQVPAIAITEVFVVADIAARDALTIGTDDGEVQEGDVVIATDASADPAITSGAASYIYDGTAYQLLKAGDEVLSVNGETGIVSLNAVDIPYSNVTSGLTATDVKGALDEVKAEIGDVSGLGTPVNYSTSSEDEVAARLSGIDSALATAGSAEFQDDQFRIIASGAAVISETQEQLAGTNPNSLASTLINRGQSFTTVDGGQLIDAAFKFKSTTTPAGTLRYKIYETLGGLPTGSPVAYSDTMDISTLPTGTEALVTLVFSTPYTLLPATQYALLPDLSGITNFGNFSIYEDSVESYAGGTRLLTTDTEASWFTGSKDMIFSVNMGAPAGDDTKKLAFEVDGITSTNTRTIIMPDNDVDLADIAANTAAISGLGSAGDLSETSAAFVDNQASAADVTGLAFAAGAVRSFDVHVTVERNALFETFRLQGVQLAAGFVMSVDSTGDDSGLEFSVTSAGQVQYTSTSTGDAGTIKFRAETLTV